jgi:NADH-quinone oxidoreductase subunit F
VTSDAGYLVDDFPRERTYALPALHAVQEHEGYLTPAALEAVSRHLRVPNSELYGIARSYSELRFQPPAADHWIEVCTGLSCRLAGADALLDELRESADAPVGPVPCRFRCAIAPIAAIQNAAHPVTSYLDHATPPRVRAGLEERRSHGGTGDTTGAVGGWPRSPEVRRLFARLASPETRLGSPSTDQLRAVYGGLPVALAMPPEAATELVVASGLLGRGGAYFPTGRKWQTAHALPGPRYLVVNAEEGEPGVFKDRFLLEHDPHLLVEGLLIAAHAIEAERVFVYVNGEAWRSANLFEQALSEARLAGLVGDLPVEVRRGAGGYVCGEESVILNSIEGERAVPRLRPPLPVERGLWGRPTVINNVETLANLPSIFRDGVAAFRSTGTEAQPGTKIISLSGAIATPGVYEVPLGTPLRAVIEELGGGALPGRELRAALCGGPSGGLIPPRLFDTPLLGGPLDAGGAALGAGGIVVIDDSFPIAEVVAHLATYNAAESCGKCTPCREGAPRMRDLLRDLAARDTSRSAPGDAIELLDALDEAMSSASLCGLGQMAALPYRSARTHFLVELTGDAS